ncbi:hypothetical protein V1514DRAFT_327370 [Lipomyces japonicus]|uniref:uncharacterized protein n=1 Tax=Lipomyces japonicus TaxID=56871 RepID=UPI0034CEEE77
MGFLEDSHVKFGITRRSFIFLRTILIGAAIFFISYAILSHTSSPQLSEEHHAESASRWNGTISREAKSLSLKSQNATLGFGDIKYISMPFRTDRQDAVHLLASIHGLKMSKVDGVVGESIHSKSVPDGGAGLRPPELGCWRAHVNVWREFLDSGKDTMLVLEDDLDFDVNIKNIFQRISIQMQHNQLRVTPPTEHEQRSAPYGLDWDVMYLGQCSDYASDRKYLSQIFDDPDTPSRADTHPHFVGMMNSLGIYGKQIGKVRVISPSWGPVCTLAYAITRAGAQRLLLNLSYLGLTTAVDVDIIRKLQAGVIRGYTITPPPFSSFRLHNYMDSDTATQKTKEEIEKEQKLSNEKDIGNLAGTSLNIRTSARHAMLKSLDRHNWEDYERLFPTKNSPPRLQDSDGSTAPPPEPFGTVAEEKEKSIKAGEAPLSEVTDNEEDTSASSKKSNKQAKFNEETKESLISPGKKSAENEPEQSLEKTNRENSAGSEQEVENKDESKEESKEEAVSDTEDTSKETGAGEPESDDKKR